MDEEEIAELSPNSCISQHALLPVVLDYFLYVLLRCRGQGTGRCMHTEAKTGGILGQKTQVHRIQHLMGWIIHSLIEVEWKSQLVFSLKYLGIYVSCESHWALIHYLRTVWVLNQDVDFNLDLNWGFRSNLTRRFLFHFHHNNLVVNALRLSLIIFARYIFWNKGGFGWSIGKMAYLVTGSHWHKS